MAAGTNLQAACDLNKIRWSCVWLSFALLRLWSVPGLRSVCWKIPCCPLWKILRNALPNVRRRSGLLLFPYVFLRT